MTNLFRNRAMFHLKALGDFFMRHMSIDGVLYELVHVPLYEYNVSNC